MADGKSTRPGKMVPPPRTEKSSSLAAAMLGKGKNIQPPRALEHASHAAEALTAASGEMCFESVDVHLLDPDPKNPRNYPWIDHENPSATVLDSAAPEYEERVKIFEDLQGMASTMRAAGVRVALEVFRKEGGRFQINAGHRRYWAARMAGLQRVPARIVAENAPRNRLSQWIENMQRTDLTLPERLKSFDLTLTELMDQEGVTLETVQSHMGLGERQFRRYRALLNAPDDIRAAIDLGTISSVIDAAQLAAISDGAARQAALAEYLQGGKNVSAAVSSVKRKQAEQASGGQSATPKKPGRKATAVRTDPIKNPAVIRHIFEKLEHAPAKVNWDDLDSVSQAWKALLAELEKQFQK